MNLFEEKYTLANGVQIPKLALKNPAITDMAKKYGDSSFFPVFGGKM